MKLPIRVAFGLVGVGILAVGFALGFSLGTSTQTPEFGSVPSTITTNRSGVQVPSYAAQKKLPALAVTTVEVITSGTESFPESVTTTPIVEETTPAVEEKREEKTPVKTPSPSPAPEPEITVGEEEQK